MINFSQVYEGWRNKLVPPGDKKNFIELASKYRTDACLKCEHHSENKKKADLTYRTIRPDHHCTHCGCTLSAKTRCLSCKCPLDKWMEILTHEQEEEFKTSINEQGNKT
jgi:hypothetical protein